MKKATLAQILADQEAKTPVSMATWIDTGAQVLIYRDRIDGDIAEDHPIVTAARHAMQDDRSKMTDTDDGKVFIEVFNPPLRMIIVGAVHIAQPLARMAAVTGYDVTVVDPRGSFATEQRFPGVTLINEWPDDALTVLDPDRRTAVVTLTHDPKIDDPALEVALGSDAFYVGALGSRKTHNARLHRLTKSDFTEDQQARIHGPVGLAIGATSPAEIAVSILAQVTDVLHRKDAE